jgi:uncharacterized protein (UPF0212 family)
VHVVVNHLHLRDPLTDDTAAAAADAVQAVVSAGGLAASVAKVGERHLVLILEFESAEDAERIAREVVGPWMREHIVPLLERDTERSVGEVIASARA